MLENVRKYQAIKFFSRKEGRPVNGVDVSLDDLVESGPGIRAEDLIRVYSHHGSAGDRTPQGIAQFSITAAHVQDSTRVRWNELEDVCPKTRIRGLTIGRRRAAGHWISLWLGLHVGGCDRTLRRSRGVCVPANQGSG